MSKFEEHEYADFDVYEVRKVVSDALMRYYSACHNSHGNCIEAVEKNVTQKLLPTLEDLVMKDIINGGSHYIEYSEFNRQRVLNFDRYPFCNYQAVKGALEKHIGVPCEGEFNLNEEGRKVLQMIDDLRNLSLRDFCDKYYVPPMYDGLEKLLGAFEKTEWHAKKCTCEEKKCVLRFVSEDKAIMVAMAQFFNANIKFFEKRNPKFESRSLCIDGYPVEKIQIAFELKRDEASQPFCLTGLRFDMKTTEGMRPPISFCVYHDQGKEFVERVTRNILVPEYKVTPAKRNDSELCQRSGEKVEEERDAAAKKEHGIFGWRKKA